MPPRRIGPYEILRRIGAGGMGAVHLALDADGRAVAVKVLHPYVAEDVESLRRLAREAEAMMRVSGPYVAELLDADFAAPEPYIVTRYVPGRSLYDIVAERGPLDGEALRSLGTGLAAALDAIHEAGVVHRDLTPRNVVLADGLPVVVDFGIARVLDATRLTQGFVGTAGYVAPELLRGLDAGPAADVFAWGATLAYAATGRQAFEGRTMLEVLNRTLNEEADLTGVPPGWIGLLRRSLRKNPEERPSTGALIGAILSVVPGQEPQSGAHWEGWAEATPFRAMPHAQPHGAERRISDLWVAAGQALEAEQVHQAEELYEDVRRIALRDGDEQAEMFALYQLGVTAEALGRYSHAVARLTEARRIAATLGAPNIEVLALRLLQRVASASGDSSLAERCERRARAVLDAKQGPADPMPGPVRPFRRKPVG